MAKCNRNAAVCLVAADEAGFSDAAFRRRILDLLVCGISSLRKKGDLHMFATEERHEPPPPPATRSRGDRLAELFEKEERSTSDAMEAEIERKIKVFDDLKAVVGGLQQSDDDDRRRRASVDVRRLAKDDPRARETAAMLGAIPPLVGLIDSSDVELQISSLYALLNLGIGNNYNKAAIVEAGAVLKLQKLIETGSGLPKSLSEAIVANFLGLSALDANKTIIGASTLSISFLIGIFQNSSFSSQARHDSLRALFNLSIPTSNIPHLVASGLVTALLASIGDMEVSDRALSVLSNAVSSPEGRRAVSRFPDVFPILIDVLSWNDASSCQEKAAYVLMVMAHKGYSDRTAMVDAGIVSALLELSLLGTALAQKRAARILECLRVDHHGKQVSEGFENGRCSPAVAGGFGGGEEETISEEKMAVRELVQQSLQNNLKRIVRRANLPNDFAPSDHFRNITATATSKSLPL